MYHLTDFCCLCLECNKNVTSQIGINSNARQIMEYIIPESVLKSQIPIQVCENCLNKINNFFKFRQNCRENILTFSEYVEKLINEHGPYKYLSVTTNDIPRGIFNEKSNCGTIIKSEILDEQENCLKENQNENMEQVQTAIETVYVKQEWSEESNIKDDTNISDNNIKDNINTNCLAQDQSRLEIAAPSYVSNNNDLQTIMSDSDEEAMSSEMTESAQSAISDSDVIPQKSVRQYESAYKDFMEWCDSKEFKSVTESVILAYFEHKIKKVKPPTLWSTYSMLKRTLNVRHNVDIKKFSRLLPYLKKESVGYRPKVSKVLTKEDIEKFIKEAPDERFLLIKVVLIIGIYGACRRLELLNLTVNDIEDKGSIVIIRIPDTKTNTRRTFIISNLTHIELYRKYYALRPAVTDIRRFFIKYVNGKCMKQVIGINKIRNVPKEIATYLKLPEADCYTGHCFRRSSATLLAGRGHEGW